MIELQNKFGDISGDDIDINQEQLSQFFSHKDFSLPVSRTQANLFGNLVASTKIHAVQ